MNQSKNDLSRIFGQVRRIHSQMIPAPKDFKIVPMTLPDLDILYQDYDALKKKPSQYVFDFGGI